MRFLVPLMPPKSQIYRQSELPQQFNEAIGLRGENAIPTYNLPSPAPTTTVKKFFHFHFKIGVLGRLVLN